MLRNLIKSLFSRDSRTSRPAARRMERAVLECLEDRRLLAAFIVTSIGDSGAGTLRDAITQANTQPGDDVITFDLPGPGPHTINLASALPDLSSSLAIQGLGADQLTVRRADAAPEFRIFTTTSGETVGLSGMTISNGRTGDNGGGISNGGTLTLTNSTVSGNAALHGGGIFNLGTLTLTSSTFSGNAASVDGAWNGDVSSFSVDAIPPAETSQPHPATALDIAPCIARAEDATTGALRVPPRAPQRPKKGS